MRHENIFATHIVSMKRRAFVPRLKRRGKFTLISMLCLMLVLPGLSVGQVKVVRSARTKALVTDGMAVTPPPSTQQGLKELTPEPRRIIVGQPVNMMHLSAQQALSPANEGSVELKPIHAPKDFERGNRGVASPGGKEMTASASAAPIPSTTGQSPPVSKSFKSDDLRLLTIPPDTMGAVGDNHVMTITNEKVVVHTRDGVVLSSVTLDAFWSSLGDPNTFDPKVLYDRFNDRFIVVTQANAFSPTSATLIAVSQTADPTGNYNRFAIDADAAATAAGGKWADYPSMGFNNNWITVQVNLFGFGTTSGYQGPVVYVLDKAAAYNNTLSSVSVFEGSFATCLASMNQNTELGCGFTMVPHVDEGNASGAQFLIEDWDSTAAQLRISKLTGTAAAPVLTVGTQFPQSLNSWRFNASLIAGSGGYVPQRQQNIYLPSGSRPTANDSRIQNAVLRNGSLWTVHHVMVAATPTLAGVPVGGVANPDIRTALQWWEIDPTIENSLVGTPPIQRARIEDPTADNCHNGAGGNRAGCTTANQVGFFFTFPNISVNQNDDVLIGYSRFSPLTLPKTAYSFRAGTDLINTTRDSQTFREGVGNYNIGAGSPFNIRWGDYSAAMVDPLNDTDFWTIQEYADFQREIFGPGGFAGVWSTWWALVKPTTTTTTAGNLIISEFRLRGPAGPRDEFVELYNPANTPLTVTTSDGSDGWALAFSANGTTITALAAIPHGTTIPARGHYLIQNSVAAAGIAPFSLKGYPNVVGTGIAGDPVRPSDGDAMWTPDLADNGGVAIFRTANPANMNAATRMDSAGFAGIAAGLFKEGTGIPNITGTPTGQISFHRNQSSGTPQDTNDNAADFIFVDPVIETLGVQPRLGAAGPENLDSPIRLLPSAMGIADSPLPTVRDTSDTGTNKTFGTLSLRRTLMNNTGSNITTMRLRAVDITTAPAPAGIADLRLLTSGDTGLVKGTTLQEPPAQPNGGGWNSSAAAGMVTLATPLAPGASINLQLLFGVEQTGTYNLCATIETLPAAGSNVICFSGNTETVPPPTPNIVPAGTSLVSESCPPANGVVDPGERVTLNFTLMNNGGAATTNLVATMQSSANVIAPSGPQNYGAIAPGGSATRPFTFTADGAPGSTIPVMLQLQDGATNLGTVTFNVTLGSNSTCRIPRLVVSSTLTRDNASTVRATYTVQNIGAVQADNVILTTAMLGSTNGTPLPQPLGSLAPGQTSAPMVVFFTNSTPGANTTLKLGGTYTSGTFSSTKRVTIP
jgi:hypothetical protein